MFQILVEESAEWPEDGELTVSNVYTGKITVSPDTARYRANGYIGGHIAFFGYAKNPQLVLNGRPRWRLEGWLRLRGLGDVGQICSVYVDARTGEVLEMDESKIESIKEYANEIAQRAILDAGAGG